MPDAFSYASPLYVLLISPAYAIGCGRMCVYAAQAAAGALVAVMILKLSLEAGSKLIPATAVALAWVLYSPAAFYELTLLPVVPLALAVSLWSLQAVRAGGPPKDARSAFAFGIACGVAAGMRPPLLLLGAYPLYIYIRRRRLKPILSSAAGILLLMLGMSAFHAAQGGDFYPFPRATGVNLVLGHSSGVTGLGPPAPSEDLIETPREDIHQVAARVAADRGYADRVSADRYWTERALRWILENPGEELSLLAAKLGGFLGYREFDVYYDTGRARSRDDSLRPLLVPRWGIVLLLALGVPAFLVAAEGRRALLLPMGVTLVAALAFVHCERYWLPALPSALAASGAGLSTVSRWMRERRWRKAAPVLALSAAIMVPGALWSPAGVPECQYLQGMAARAYNMGEYSRALVLFERSALTSPPGSITALYSRYEALRIARALGMRERAEGHASLLRELMLEEGIEPPPGVEPDSIDSRSGRN